VDAIVKKVSPSVVQILVTGYGPLEEGEHGNTTAVIGRQRAIGSGFVIDPTGYIVTNAHVVNGAQRVQVVLPSDKPEGTLEAALSTRTTVVPARLVGVARDIDLAVIKVDAGILPALALSSYRKLGQGEIVFAFGSPQGLRNTVTMGVVSAVARQTEPDSPMVYVQTDAPINPGNSGGPLVNVNGEVVGVNTFILSQSGGNEGLGFAIPSNVVNVAFRQLRKYGHLHRAEIGIGIQTITPTWWLFISWWSKPETKFISTFCAEKICSPSMLRSWSRRTIWTKSPRWPTRKKILCRRWEFSEWRLIKESPRWRRTCAIRLGLSSPLARRVPAWKWR
jgi:serine protease Do